uniref:Uncharacterized protein n=1 Tax=Anguilla anguilla TaxID=7936 RepID=A0A0E9TPV5_ANGAN
MDKQLSSDGPSSPFYSLRK